jgi:hypothetical protein
VLLAEIEIWHTRPAVPTDGSRSDTWCCPSTRRPGFGGLLLGAIVAEHLYGVDDDSSRRAPADHLDRDTATRIVQPRLRHRFQVDRHGLAKSHHRMLGNGDDISFDFRSQGTDLAQVLGAIYAVERLAPEHRRQIAPVLQKAARWRGPIGPSMIAYLAGSQTLDLEALADPRAWAMDILGFEVGSARRPRSVT